jgi:hypothetical protein
MTPFFIVTAVKTSSLTNEKYFTARGGVGWREEVKDIVLLHGSQESTTCLFDTKTTKL